MHSLPSVKRYLSWVLTPLLVGFLIAAFSIPIRDVSKSETPNAGWHEQDPGLPAGVTVRGPLDIEIISGKEIGLEIALPVDPVGRWTPESLEIDYSQWKVKDELSDRIVSLVPNAQLHWKGQEVNSFSMGLITEGESTTVTLIDNLTNDEPLTLKVENDGLFVNATHIPSVGIYTDTLLLMNARDIPNEESSNVWWGNRLVFSSGDQQVSSIPLTVARATLDAIRVASIVILGSLFSLLLGLRLKRWLRDDSAGVGLTTLTGFVFTLLAAGALNYLVRGTLVAATLFLSFFLLLIHALYSKGNRSKLFAEFKAIDPRNLMISFGFLGVTSLTISAYANWTVGLAQTDVFDYFFGIHSGLNNSYFSGNIVTGNGMRSLDFASRSLWGSALPDMMSISLWAITGLFVATFAISETFKRIFGSLLYTVLPGLILISGAFVGMWTEAYMSRWYVSFCAIVATALVVVVSLERSLLGPIYVFTLFLLTASQLVIVPVFLAVPTGTAIALMFVWRQIKSQDANWRTEIKRILSSRQAKIILSTSGVLAVMNLLWLRSLSTTLALTSDQLNGIVKNFVLPFYNQPEFVGTLLGLLPWHGIEQSRWGIPTAVPGSQVYEVVVSDLAPYLSYWYPIAAASLGALVLGILIFVTRSMSKKTLSKKLLPSLILIALVIVQGVVNTLLSERSLYTVLMYMVTLAPTVFIGTVIVAMYVLVQKSSYGFLGRVTTFMGALVVVTAIGLNVATSSIELSRWNDSAQHILSVEAIAQSAKSEGFESIQIQKSEPMTNYEYVYVSNVITSRIQDLGMDCENCVQQENRISSTNPVTLPSKEETSRGVLIIGGQCTDGLKEVSKYDWLTLCRASK